MVGSCFDLRPEPEPLERPRDRAGAGLSWLAKDVDREVGEKGWNGTNPYHERPIAAIENRSMWEPQRSSPVVYIWVRLDAILKENPFFGCENRSFYRNGTGPILNVSEDVQTHRDIEIVYDYQDSYILKYFGACCYTMIAFFAGLVIFGLHSGRYNQLLFVVTFKEGKEGKIEPKKLSFAWTIMCNAKTISSIAFKEVCGSLALFTIDENRSSNNHEEYSPEGVGLLAALYLFGSVVILVWAVTYFFSCGNACCIPDSIVKEWGWAVFRHMVLMNVTFMYLIWLIDLDPPSEFNPETPWLYFTNVVAWCDLAVNTLYDIYDAVCNGNLLWACGRPASAVGVGKKKRKEFPRQGHERDERQVEDTETGTEGPPPPAMPPPRQ